MSLLDDLKCKIPFLNTSRKDDSNDEDELDEDELDEDEFDEDEFDESTEVSESVIERLKKFFKKPDSREDDETEEGNIESEDLSDGDQTTQVNVKEYGYSEREDVLLYLLQIEYLIY